MKNIIFYFSGSGNSLYLARTLSEHLDASSLVPLLNYSGTIRDPENIDTIGIVYPVHMNALPKPVKRFLAETEFPPDTFTYVVAANGGYHGKAGTYLLHYLRKHDIELDAYFPVEMLNNTPKGVAPKMFMTLDWEKRITEKDKEEMHARAGDLLPKIITAIRNKDGSSLKEQQDEEHGFYYHFMKLTWKLSELMPPTLEFFLDDSCDGCRICEKVCTSGTIAIKDDRPVWQNDVPCNFCYACFNFCPRQAIYVEHYSKKLGRYHHPEIDWKDIAKQKPAT